MYDEAQKNCIIFHFAGDMFNRPWHKNSRQPYHEEFLEYLDDSPWKGSKLLKRRYAKKKLSALYMYFFEIILWHFWKRNDYENFIKTYKCFLTVGKKISGLIHGLKVKS
jgi:hypothetical protein